MIYGFDYFFIIEGDDRFIVFMIFVYLDILEGIKIFVDVFKLFGCDGVLVSVSGNDYLFIV